MVSRATALRGTDRSGSFSLEDENESCDMERCWARHVSMLVKEEWFSIENRSDGHESPVVPNNGVKWIFTLIRSLVGWCYHMGWQHRIPARANYWHRLHRVEEPQQQRYEDIVRWVHHCVETALIIFSFDLSHLFWWQIQCGEDKKMFSSGWA